MYLWVFQCVRESRVVAPLVQYQWTIMNLSPCVAIGALNKIVLVSLALVSESNYFMAQFKLKSLLFWMNHLTDSLFFTYKKLKLKDKTNFLKLKYSQHLV